MCARYTCSVSSSARRSTAACTSPSHWCSASTDTSDCAASRPRRSSSALRVAAWTNTFSFKSLNSQGGNRTRRRLSTFYQARREFSTRARLTRYLRPQGVPPRGDRVDLRADPAGHDVRVGQLPPEVLDARETLVAVILDVVLEVLQRAKRSSRRAGRSEGGRERGSEDGRYSPRGGARPPRRRRARRGRGAGVAAARPATRPPAPATRAARPTPATPPRAPCRTHTVLHMFIIH